MFYEMVTSDCEMLRKKSIKAIVKWFVTYYDDHDRKRYFSQIIHIGKIFSHSC